LLILLVYVDAYVLCYIIFVTYITKNHIKESASE
jgi:hypothetical protein